MGTTSLFEKALIKRVGQGIWKLTLSDETPTLTSRVPYLLRAMYEWIVDNEQTPYIVVDATNDDVMVPRGQADDDRIILNVSRRAVEELNMSNEAVSFVARFSGVSESIFIPSYAILGIYAKESGEGMIFAAEPTSDDEPPKETNKPALRVVK